MPRPPNIIPPSKLHTSLPTDLRGWLEVHLWSDAEMCVPRGAYQNLIVRLLREYMSRVEAAQVAAKERKNDPDT